MNKNKEAQIYRVENTLWERLSKVIPEQKGSGRRPNDNKGCFEGIIYVMRTGCQWKELPKEYPPKSTVHDSLQRWRELGLFLSLWKELLIEYDDFQGLDWEWLSGDTSMVKSPLGGKKNRAKPDRQEKTWN